MPYRSNHVQGGLRAAYWIECATCGATSPAQPTERQAWASIKQAGWHERLSFPMQPQCPQCVTAAIPTPAPYYADELVTLYHGNALAIRDWTTADVLVTDPPYGIAYQSNHGDDGIRTLPRAIEGDDDTTTRDAALRLWGDRPALVFGTWRAPRPDQTRMVLVWDTKGANGMGDVRLPWKPAHQEVYVLGSGFTGHRGSDVLCYPPVQSMAKNGRMHPHQKPVDLLRDLIAKCPPGVIADPFAGVGSTLRAAKDLGRRAIGVEMDERYCELAARRLGQEVLAL